MRAARLWRTSILAGAAFGLGTIQGAVIPLPNGSFEAPATVFVNTHVDNWQKGPKPDWYVETDEYRWDQLTGVFKNPAPSAVDHLQNCDGAQALWLFAVPEVELSQDYLSQDWNDPSPTHAFDARFQVGKAYELTVGINGGGGGMQEGVTMEISLYYRNDDGEAKAVAATTISHSAETFPNHTWFTDFSARVGTVQPSDAWAGRHIGVRIRSTVPLESQGGYWDLDNVRVVETPETSLTLTSTLEGTDLRVGWLSTQGFEYQVEVSENLVSWTAYEAPLAGTGGPLFRLVAADQHPPAFVRVQATPAR
ncbi:MAG TPA: hypothetical protein PLX89_18800 [Verrucomicrobiota bacterium]|nr:hypothetical protein [Verrucomicrobiota bacterium]